MISRLRLKLEGSIGEERFEILVPNAFLPPRFRRDSEGQDLSLLVDQDLTIYVYWKGERLERYTPLTKGETRRLLREVKRSMAAYRRDLDIYGRFIETWGEEPFEDPRSGPSFSIAGPPVARMEEPEEDNNEDLAGDIVASVTPRTSIDKLGGESPLPDLGWEDV